MRPFVFLRFSYPKKGQHMGCYKNKKADGPGGEHAGNNHDKVHF